MKHQTRKLNKIIECGEFLEIVRRMDPSKFSWDAKSSINTKTPIDRKTHCIQSSIYRTRRRVELLTLSNYQEKTTDPTKPYTTHMVLTFDKKVYSYEKVKKEIKKFVSRLNRRMKKLFYTNAKYLATIEFHEDMRSFHIHILIFNFYEKLNDLIQKIWNRGRVNVKIINNTYEDIKRVANYICKQFPILRELFENDNLFISSMNLKKPMIYYLKRIPHVLTTLFKQYWKRGRIEIWIKKKNLQFTLTT